MVSGGLGLLIEREQKVPLQPLDIDAIAEELSRRRKPCRTVGNYLLKEKIPSQGYDEYWADEVGHREQMVRMKKHRLNVLDVDLLTQQHALAKRHFEALKRLESRRLSALPNVYTSFPDPDDESLWWTAYEPVDGAPIMDARLTGTARIAALAQMAATLAECHAAGIVHRALSPECLFVDRNLPGEAPRPHILHFDFAKIYDRTTIGEAVRRQSHGPLRAFIAPEVRGNPSKAETWSDVFAFGVVIAHVMAEVPTHDASPPLAEILMRLQPALRSLVSKMTAKEPEARCNMLEVATRLRQRSS